MQFNMDQMLPYRDEVKAAVNRVIDSGWYLGGEETKKFEEEWAALVRQRYAVAVGNGTDAIRIALLALGIGPGDEVLTPAFCVGFTGLAIAGTGATPVFVDTAEPEFIPGWWDYSKYVTPRTRAVVPVDLFGQAADDSIALWAHERGLVVVEDAAHAHGHDHIGYGDVTAFSFYPTKNLGALGEAGALTTNIPAVAERARLLRDGGRTDRYVHVPPGGLNSMMDDIQAAVLRVKLRHLYDRTIRRREIARRYDLALGPIKGLRVPTRMGGDVYHLYVIVTSKREALRLFLTEKGIPTLVHYPLPVPMQPVFMGENLNKGPWPYAEQLGREILSLPMHADLTDEEVDRVAAAIHEFFAKA